MRLVPRFTPYTRFYSVIFHDYDNNEVFRVDDLQFEDNVYNAVKNNPQVHYLYRKSDGLAAGYRYALKGWQTEASFSNPEKLELYKLDDLKIVDNMEMWAYYESEEVATTASPMNIFMFSGSGNNTTISIKEEYRNLVGGDITIPTKNNTKADVFILKDFQNMPLITGIYFLNDAKYTTVADSCFLNNMAVEIDLPNTITTIDSSAFDKCNSLTTVNYTGTKAQWNAIQIGANNAPLVNATINYNYVMPTK
jgi:hypothetical protein